LNEYVNTNPVEEAETNVKAERTGVPLIVIVADALRVISFPFRKVATTTV
jgi:hypothetical protein